MSDNDDIVNRLTQQRISETDKTLTQKDESREEKTTETLSTKEEQFQQIEGLNQISTGMQSQGISTQGEVNNAINASPSHSLNNKPDNSDDVPARGLNAGNAIKNGHMIGQSYGQSMQEKSPPQKGEEPEME